MFKKFTTNITFVFQLWTSSKWSIKDEYKLLSELGGAGGATGYYGELFEAPYEHPHYTPHSGKFPITF